MQRERGVCGRGGEGGKWYGQIIERLTHTQVLFVHSINYPARQRQKVDKVNPGTNIEKETETERAKEREQEREKGDAKSQASPRPGHAVCRVAETGSQARQILSRSWRRSRQSKWGTGHVAWGRGTASETFFFLQHNL